MNNSAEAAAIGVMVPAGAMRHCRARMAITGIGPSSKQLTGAASGWRVMRCAVAELSPAARAVLDAALPAYDDEHLYILPAKKHASMIAVAALRAAVDQVIPEDGDMPLNMAHRLSWDARQQVRQQLLAISAELESAQ